MSAELAERLPVRTEDFLGWLDEYWPHRCPEITNTMEEIHRYAGARDLIDAMRNRWRNEQEDDRDSIVESRIH